MTSAMDIGDTEKSRFYEMAAKRFKAELRLYGATAAVHLENKNDEVFWGKVLRHVCPGGKFRFIAGSRNPNGNVTCGCSQCLQYKPFLSRKFIIAIDSDYRYLSEEPDIDARHHILQTYTYSFENHFCYADNVNRAVQEACQSATTMTDEYDFRTFLAGYSRIVYPLLVWQLYLADCNPEAFPKHVFHRLLTLPVGKRSLDNDGGALLQVLKIRAHKMRTHFRRLYPEADLRWHEKRCRELGVRPDNAYLFVRGHQLYDCVNMQGRKLVGQKRKRNPSLVGGRSFEYFLTRWLCFGAYAEIRRVEEDVRIALELPVAPSATP